MGRLLGLVAAVYCAVGCGGDDDGARSDAAPPPDARAADASSSVVDAPVGPDADVGPDAAPPESGGALLVTKTPGGNVGVALWDGILLYDIPTTGADAVQSADIDKSLVADPAGLAFRPGASEVLVGNRHGNTAADGTAGSITRFDYDPVARTFTPAGAITGNGLAGVHQVTVSPTTGELFAANVNAGVSRFTFDVDDDAVPNGTISNGATRGVVVSPDGARLYLTSANNVIRMFDLGTGAEATPLTLGTTANLHFMAIRQGQLYAAALADGKVYRFDIGVDNGLTLVEAIDSPTPVAVAFSEDETEMFVSGHLSGDLVARFRYDATEDTWTRTGEIVVSVSLGGVVMLPTR